MSAADVKQLADALAEADKNIAEAEKFMAELEGCGSGHGISVAIGGLNFPVTRIAPRSYTYEVVPGRRALHEAVVGVWRERLIGLRGRREGLARSLKAAADALTKEGGAR